MTYFRLSHVAALFAVCSAAPLRAPLPAQMAQRTRLAPAAVREDLAAFRSQFLAVDKSYTPASRADAESRLARLEAAADTVQAPYLELALARIAALADNGHTGVAGGRWPAKFNHVGIGLTPFGDQFHVLIARDAWRDVLGGRLVAIDGRDITTLRNAARALRGGTPAFRDRFAPYFFESPELLHAAGLTRATHEATYEFELPDGRRVSRRMTAEPPDSTRLAVSTRRWLMPERGNAPDSAWRTLLAPTQVSWPLLDPPTPFRVRAVPELEALQVEFRMNVDAPGRSILFFIGDVERAIEQQRPRHIILDMRHNGGGNLNTTRGFVQRLAANTPGRVFVLTSPWTFSAAISTVGYLKQAAPDKVVIVGEEVGDRMEFFAEGRPTTLPNSRIVVGLATERHDYRGGCTGFSDCHRAVVQNPIRMPTLAPDVPAPWTFAAYRAGRDPAMDSVAAIVRRR